MPTKPVTSFTFATDPTFGAGPAAGSPTKVIPTSLLQGFVPGTGIASEHVSYLENITGDWIANWLLLGTNANDEDAHLVETDSIGRANLARISVSGASALGIASVAILAPAAAGGPALSVANTTASADFAATVSKTTTGSIAATRTQNNNGDGAALEAVVAGTGIGYAVSATTVDAVGSAAPVHVEPRAVEPGAGVSADGDVYYDSDSDKLRARAAGAWQSLWGTPNGFARGYAEALAETSTSSGGSLTAKATVILTAASELRLGARLHLRAVCEIGTSVAGAAVATVGITDVTAALDVINRTVRTYQASAAAEEKYVVLDIDYILPASGARTFFLGFISNGADTTFIRNATFEVTGQY